MPKTIYTDRDVEELVRRGAKEIVLTDDIYLTDVARERAEKLGVALRAASPSSTAEARLVIPRGNTDQLVSQVKADVVAKLGGDVDAAVIERIVRRVVSQL